MNIDFSKNTDGLIPAIIQDSETKTVLMLGFMNAEAYHYSSARFYYDGTDSFGMMTHYSGN